MISKAPGPVLPRRIGRLNELAHNLWWSWHSQARDLFRTLDYPVWKLGGHNPVKLLREISPVKLQVASIDPAFLTLYDTVMEAFDADMAADNTWYAAKHRNDLTGPIAYFSAEFAIHNSLPLYAGGLGILAGDICKESSDLGLPLIGVGLMYPQGYFHQRISADGWQEEIYTQLDFDEAPVTQIFSSSGHRPLAQFQLGQRDVSIGVWQALVGRTTLYLLDANIEENTPEDRQLSARLYTADREIRIKQEILLGIGGVRVLRALGIQPAIWHANEGHTAFMMLERIREEVGKGIPLAEAIHKVKTATVFTTHTPVPAGHDVFSVEIMAKYFSNYFDSSQIDRDAILELGQENGHDDGVFNMTAFALATADRYNAVSQLHGMVARKMWHGTWPEVPEDKVPILHVTNGIHVPTWIAPEMGKLYEKYLGQDWMEWHDDPHLWEHIIDIPDHELWKIRRQLKSKLLGLILEFAQRGWANGELEPKQIMAMGTLLHPEVLTIGFVRRFAGYKRPALIFRDIERLKRLTNDPFRPIQIVFAGKSHPADYPSKQCLHEVCTLAANREFMGRIAFLGDHDMHTARLLVQGVDLWLNNPRRLQEACGTSGMKASLNGVPQLSVSDGWWYEGYNGVNGWVIGNGLRPPSPEEEDKADAEALYQLLEGEIVPRFYERDLSGVPHGWISVVKEAIRSIVPVFCARRMMKEYTDRLYIRQPASSPR